MYKPIAHAHHVSPGQPWIRSLELLRQESHRLADDLKVSDHGVNGLLVIGEPVEVHSVDVSEYAAYRVLNVRQALTPVARLHKPDLCKPSPELATATLRA